MVWLIDSLTEAVTTQKLTKASKEAMQMFFEYRDTRWHFEPTAAYIAANMGSNRALRLLHERRRRIAGAADCGTRRS